MTLRRREFITLLGGAAAARPVTVRAQQLSAPVVGYLDLVSAQSTVNLVAAFRKGLDETGYVEGRNVAIEYRWADNQGERLLALATDLVRRNVAVIATPNSTLAAIAAKAATSKIPIVFGIGTDPVETGLVESLSHPGANLTGVTRLSHEAATKRLGLLHAMVPSATSIAVLSNSAIRYEADTKELQTAASLLGLHLILLDANSISEIEAVFAGLSQQGAGGLFVSSENFFFSRRGQITTLGTRYAVPSIYPSRDWAEVGGLMTYGASNTDSIRQVGVYTGRILKGARPADLPVMQAATFEFTINLPTARALGLTVPANLLAIANEVIE
jgi:putative tryptophan/tyrosine transport system substrate-binding protein